MRHSHNSFRARVCVQYPTYPPSIFSAARLMNAGGHVRYLLRAVVRVFILYLVLLLAVYISAQLITPPPSGSEVPVSGNDLMDDAWPQSERNDDCLHCLFEEWMKGDPGMSDLLSCSLSDEVTMTPVHVRPTHLLLSMKCCSVVNAMIRRTAVLTTVLLCHVVLVALVSYLGLRCGFPEVMWPTSTRRKRGERDISSPRRKESVLKCVYVHSPFTVCVAAVKRYKRRAVSKQLRSLLARFPSAKLQRGLKSARRIHGHLVVSFTIQRSFVMRIRVRRYLAFVQCVAHLVGRLSQAVSVSPYTLLRKLLLQAGDVEVNPGPTHMEQVLDELRPRFIEEIDSNVIVFNLKHLGIISDRDLKTINQNDDRTWQNQFLFDHVRSKCDEEALMKFCDEVISVEGNPKMKAFGEDMKRMLKGRNLGSPDNKEEEAKARAADDFKKSLDAALAKGSVEVEIVKCVTLGPPEAGKTQLKETLVGRFDDISESTPMSTGAEVVMQRYVQGDTSWEPLTRERLRKSLHTTVKEKTFTESTSTASRSEVLAPEQEIQTIPTGTQEGGSQRVPCGDRIESRKALHESFAAVRASVEEGLKEADPTEVRGLQKMRIIHLIDSGGQPAFFDFHPVIATSRAVYFLVYNMEDEDEDKKKGLDAKPKITYRKKKFPTKDLPNEKQSNLSIIKDSLLTLHDCKQKFISMEGELHRWFGDSISKSADVLPVLVVGTRKREKEVIASESKKLVNECSYLPLWKKVLHCAQTGTKLFAVESTDRTCQGVQAIRREVDRAGCMYKLQLPISWFFCQLIFWSVNEDLHVLIYADLQYLCQRGNLVADSDEFRAMVRTFHLLGIFSFPYFDQELTLGSQWKPDDKPVFTNPDVLYQQVTKILEIAFRDLDMTEMEPEARESLMELQSNGQLDKHTLGHLGIPDQLGSYTGFHSYLLERLVQWGLAATPAPVTSAKLAKPAPVTVTGAPKPAPLTSEEATGTYRLTYFIPSALPACDKEPLKCTDSHFRSLAFTFRLSLPDGKIFYYVPRGIFPHLIVQAKGKGYIIQYNTDYEKDLFRDVAVFSIVPKQFAYNVMVVDKMDHIAISIDPADELKERSSYDECRKIISDFRDAMKATYERIYHTSLDVTVAYKCMCKRPEAPPSHLAEIRSQYGCCVLQCLQPRQVWQKVCDPEIAALLYDQDVPGPSGSGPPCAEKPRSNDSRQATAEAVLEHFRDDFIKDMDANAVVFELYDKDIINGGDKNNITENKDPTQQNQILHLALKQRCTDEALLRACGIIIAVKNNAKMKALGESMKRMLTGN